MSAGADGGDDQWACDCGCSRVLPIPARLAADIRSDDGELAAVALEHGVPIWVVRHIRFEADSSANGA